ncbi:2'-5' RNA ligase family protein [Paenibacillus alkaliterrae]|uniref:2'-5' RNA ligase family protein n=1 Tax=Paenibacillus alkaliterrae TaxID=320909 RepID=UPI001F2A504D|nr:2'-5' RNA ligase family protein [Paenibacillus alkaliterrae]MCF2939281.1 2'-5' RNA ligase family protein [Paenibacillus alkaliterrae]
MLFGIAIFPEKHVQDLANSWRRRHDPHYCLIPAHMTVREEEEWTDEQLQLAVEHLEKITSAFPPFSVHFNRVSSFYPVNNVLYLALKETAAMQKLHGDVCSGPLTNGTSKYVYTPHLTIGQNMSAEELHDQYGNLRMQTFDITSRLDRIHLLYQTDNGSWTAYQTFLLRG